jgi:hypothetical protein
MIMVLVVPEQDVVPMYTAAKVPTQFVMLSEAKHLPGNQRPFAEFILRHRRAQGDNAVKTFAQAR